MLHELLTGRQLVGGDNEFEMMQQHVSGSPVPVRTLRPDVPEVLERLILDLLAKAPDRRPADAYEVYQRLLPLLPPVGSEPPAAGSGPSGMPDPTRLYRWPNAPRPRLVEPAVPVSPAPTAVQPSPVDTRLDDVIKAAVSESDVLLEDERFKQAAEALEQAITPAAEVLGTESLRVLKLRSRRAAILVLGGDFRRALPEFDALAAAYARTAGPASAPALDCLRQAAHCRAELGDTTAALRQFQHVLAYVREAGGDASPMALDLRRSIGILLLAEGRTTEAERTLQPLHDDLALVYGADHEETREIAGILTRLRSLGVSGS